METTINLDYINQDNQPRRRRLKRTLLAGIAFWAVWCFYLLILGSYKGYKTSYVNQYCQDARTNCTQINLMNDCYSTAFHCQNITCFNEQRNTCIKICSDIEQNCNKKTELFINEKFKSEEELEYKDTLGRIIVGKNIYNSRGDTIVPNIPKGPTYFLYVMTVLTSLFPIIQILTGRWC